MGFRIHDVPKPFEISDEDLRRAVVRFLTSIEVLPVLDDAPADVLCEALDRLQARLRDGAK